MGNKRNKYFKYNRHRGRFAKRYHAEKYKKNTQTQHTNVQSDVLQGSRIVNLENLQQYITKLTAHAEQCSSEIILEGERRDGLASIISSRCSKCDHKVLLETSRKVKGPKGYQRWECNLAAVWGQMSTGGGHTRLHETMGTLGVPVMSKNTFTHTERHIGERWREQLQETMREAGKEEKRLAEERGDFNEGVPAITVIVDGGWSKRSHRHSYNAKSGVGIIIGQATGKLLYIGVRNKYCTACTQGITKENHTCFKNWDESSCQMEPDIILEGFQQAEAEHGVRYMRFIGDGDSSVYSTLVQNVTSWGRHIKKLECANHACKCYRSALEKLVQEKTLYEGRGGLTQRMRQRLTSAARCAIKMRSKETDVNKAVKLLEKDLQNGPYHCFGHHDNCSSDFCLVAKERASTSPTVSAVPDSTDDIQSSSDLEGKISIINVLL